MDAELVPQPLPRARAVIVSLAFVALTALGPLLWVFGPAVKSRAAKPWPEWSTDAFLEGRYTEELRVHLRETSPITITLRGVTSELLYLFGLGDEPVLIGSGGVMFNTFTVRPTVRAIEQYAAQRERFAVDLTRWAERHGVRILVVVIPDKIRVMPERLFADGQLPEPKAGSYARFLAPFAAAGLVTVDVATAMQAWRAEQPELALYQERDTHWTDAGAWRTGRLLADRLVELGWVAGMTPEPLIGPPFVVTRSLHDLTDQFGFLEHGLLDARLRDTRRSAALRIANPGGLSTTVDEDVPGAGVALCGDSFAAGGLAFALPAALGMRVDRVGAVSGGGPFEGLMLTLGRIAGGESRARVVVWEVIERSFLTSVWDAPPSLPE